MSKQLKQRKFGRAWIAAFAVMLGVTALAPQHSIAQKRANSTTLVGTDGRRDTGRLPNLSLLLEPIPGLTTVTHVAPDETGVPIGAVLRFSQAVSPGLQIVWDGAEVLSSSNTESRAECHPTSVGDFVVRSYLRDEDGRVLHTNTCTLHVLPVSIAEIQIRPISPTVASFDVDDDSTSEVTMDYYFGDSIAGVTCYDAVVGGALSKDGAIGVNGPVVAQPRRCTTSIDRTVTLIPEVFPAAFAPLMEWRVASGNAVLAPQLETSFGVPGTRVFEVGPVDRPAIVKIEAYRVSITSHENNTDIALEREAITFTAVTDPPGFEDDITWLSSTKFGTGTPVFGYGPEFTVTFDDTWGPHPTTGGPFQWLGVKADNAAFNQDTKVDLCDEANLVERPDPFSSIEDLSSVEFGSKDIPAIPSDFFGPGSDAYTGNIKLSGFQVGDFADSGLTDSKIIRRDPVLCPGTGFPRACDPVRVEIAEMTMVGEPITVTFNGGQDPEEWLVSMSLSENQSEGTLNATLTSAGGGTYTVDLFVLPVVVFARTSQVAALDAGAIEVGDIELKILDFEIDEITPVNMSLSEESLWFRDPPDDGGFSCEPQGFDVGNGFFPLPLDCKGAGCHGGPGHQHCVCRPPPPPPGLCEYSRIARIFGACNFFCPAPAIGKCAWPTCTVGPPGPPCMPFKLVAFRCRPNGGICVGFYISNGCTGC